MNKPRRPILVLLLSILQLIVGGLLLVCGALDVVAAVAGQSSATVTVYHGLEKTTQTYDTRAEMEKRAHGYTLFFVGGSVASFLLHFAMVAGAVGLLLVRRWGWWLTFAWAVLRFAYQLLTLGYLWYAAIPATGEMAKSIPRDEENVLNGMVNGNTFYHIGWAGFSLVFAFYPLLILPLLLLPPVWRAFRRGSTDVPTLEVEVGD